MCVGANHLQTSTSPRCGCYVSVCENECARSALHFFHPYVFVSSSHFFHSLTRQIGRQHTPTDRCARCTHKSWLPNTYWTQNYVTSQLLHFYCSILLLFPMSRWCWGCNLTRTGFLRSTLIKIPARLTKDTHDIKKSFYLQRNSLTWGEITLFIFLPRSWLV